MKYAPTRHRCQNSDPTAGPVKALTPPTGTSVSTPSLQSTHRQRDTNQYGTRYHHLSHLLSASSAGGGAFDPRARLVLDVRNELGVARLAGVREIAGEEELHLL